MIGVAVVVGKGKGSGAEASDYMYAVGNYGCQYNQARYDSSHVFTVYRENDGKEKIKRVAMMI